MEIAIALLVSFGGGFVIGRWMGIRQSFQSGYNTAIKSFRKALSAPDGYEIDSISYRKKAR